MRTFATTVAGVRVCWQRRVRWVLLAALSGLTTGCSTPQQETAPATTSADGIQHRLAESYGLARWNEIERIDFTYHEEAPDRRIQRRWTWEPVNDWVTLHGEASGGSVSYQTHALSADTPAEIVQAHRWFVHDRRRLLLPFEVVWHAASVRDEGVAPLPHGSGQARRYTISFSQPDGTQQRGVLFVDHATQRIVQTHHPTPAGAVATRWEDHASVGPIVVAMRRVGSDGSVAWFSDVRVK